MSEILNISLLDQLNVSQDIKVELLSLFSPRNYSKGDLFAEYGEYSYKVAFINSGVLRAYYRKDNGEEYNKTFFTNGNFVGAYSSLVTGNSNLIYIDCLTDCELSVANYKEILNLYDKYPKLEKLGRILAEQFFVSKERREIELVTLEAKERYNIFRREFPHLEQLIPQYHIASYLGVSATQLSRIRASKSK